MIRNDVQELKLLEIDQLEPFQGSLKDLSKENYQKLKKQILDLGFSEPVTVWEKEGIHYLINGHQRHRALLQMREEGFSVPKIPSVIIRAKSEKEAKKKILSLTSQFGQITPQGLYEFASLADIKIDELEDLRFPEINMDDFKSEYVEDEPAPGAGKEDEIPDQVDAVCKEGDLWQLGEHRLLCGDATSINAVEKLMGGEKADITFTSPPYNAGCFGYDGGKDKYKGKSDNKSQEEYFDFLCSFTDIALSISNIVFFNNQFLSGNRHALAKFIGHYSSMFKDIFPWIKNTAPPNVNKGFFTNRFEIILALEKNCQKKGFNVSWQGKYHNIIEGHTAEKENVTDGKHSATMPLYVIEWFVERIDYIKSIYDPFGGSGSTLIACEKTGRKCFMMELDPHYCDVIIKRWEDYTGQKAALLNGKKSDKVKTRSKISKWETTHGETKAWISKRTER